MNLIRNPAPDNSDVGSRFDRADERCIKASVKTELVAMNYQIFSVCVCECVSDFQ